VPIAPLLSIAKLRIGFAAESGRADVVRDLDLVVGQGETVGIVGESGSGKSVTALAVMRLLPPTTYVEAAALQFGPHDLLNLSHREMERIRGKEIGMIFQEPMTSLNPVLTVGEHLVETIRRHRPVTRRAARIEAIELLRAVRIPDPDRRIDEYPHRLSGGQRQRVMIALALSCRPKLLIADEPTTALDVTVQAQILDLLQNLQYEFGVAILLISHDLHMVASIAHRVVVMYAGEKVEEAAADTLFRTPAHPYTQGLLGATPRGMRGDDGVCRRLKEIPGRVPNGWDLPAGCVFSPRCPHVVERCRLARPPLYAAGDAAMAACFRLETS
jgi:oligopeptide/dipeptide ABC transporter ATP-binding protein